MKRKIIRIDPDVCNGCGQCLPNCPEGALQLIDGKARLVSDLFCDGLGACIGTCPLGAIHVEEREAEAYDERKIMANIVPQGANCVHAHLEQPRPTPGVPHSSELRTWPVQLQLLNPQASFLDNADLLVAADCVPFACASFHEDFLAGKVPIIFCPKLDPTTDQYLEKLTAILRLHPVRSLHVVHMEVPCCSGTTMLVRQALARAGKDIPLHDYTVSIQGELIAKNQISPDK